jgi:hypothetical protein
MNLPYDPKLLPWVYGVIRSGKPFEVTISDASAID